MIPTGLRFLIVAFDGLRPDMAMPALMPNLSRMRALGVEFANHRAVFPSDTRANVASLVTGAYPGRHGFLGNAYYDAAAHPSGVFDTINAELIEACDAAHDGRLFSVEALGDILGRAGRSVVVIGAASRGTTRAIHHKVRQFRQHLCLAVHFADTSWPGEAVAEIESRFGPLPPAAQPDLAALGYGTDVFLDHVWPERRPDLTILWFNEPDTSYHHFGIGSPEALGATAEADRQFGRILDWWEHRGRDDGVQLIALSDHGHLTTHERTDVVGQLKEAGFHVGGNFEGDADLVVVPATAGYIHVRDRRLDLMSIVVDFLTGQEWCGHLFTQARNEIDGQIEGTFARNMIFADHQRSAEVIYTLRADDGLDRYGLVGRSYFDAGDPHRSMHGGLHPKELECLALAAGSLFGVDEKINEHTGIVDIAPTILHGLGLPQVAGRQGRVITAALRNRGRAMASIPETFEVGRGAYRQSLRRVRVGDTVYLDGGLVA